METGAITGYIDVAQLVLYVFWIFFFVLVFWLHREGKREGYPLQPETGVGVEKQGFPAMAKPKTYLRRDGTRITPETDRTEPSVSLKRTSVVPGSPYEPEGDPMKAAVGPGSYSNRADLPDVDWDGNPTLVPLRNLPEHNVDPRDPDPRGMDVIGADGAVGGRVVDIWVDLSEEFVRYYEIELPGGASAPAPSAAEGEGEEGAAPPPQPSSSAERRLVPVNFTRIPSKKGPVKVGSIKGAHFRDVPKTAKPDLVTKLEEDKVQAYYGAGYLYADPKRQEPLL